MRDALDKEVKELERDLQAHKRKVAELQAAEAAADERFQDAAAKVQAFNEAKKALSSLQTRVNTKQTQLSDARAKVAEFDPAKKKASHQADLRRALAGACAECARCVEIVATSVRLRGERDGAKLAAKVTVTSGRYACPLRVPVTRAVTRGRYAS